MTNTYTKYFINIWLSEEGIRWQSQSLAFGVRFWRGLASTLHRLTLAMEKARICRDCRTKRTYFCSGGNLRRSEPWQVFCTAQGWNKQLSLCVSVCACVWTSPASSVMLQNKLCRMWGVPVPLCVVYCSLSLVISLGYFDIAVFFLQLIDKSSILSLWSVPTWI